MVSCLRASSCSGDSGGWRTSSGGSASSRQPTARSSAPPPSTPQYRCAMPPATSCSVYRRSAEDIDEVYSLARSRTRRHTPMGSRSAREARSRHEARSLARRRVSARASARLLDMSSMARRLAMHTASCAAKAPASSSSAQLNGSPQTLLMSWMTAIT
eukprot:scaffold33571_cov59-Phaeocystis_antarctica.AAC.1